MKAAVDVGTDIIENADLRCSHLLPGKVYIGDQNHKVTIFAHGKQKKIVNVVDIGGPVFTTPVAANGVLYIATKSKLYALAEM